MQSPWSVSRGLIGINGRAVLLATLGSMSAVVAGGAVAALRWLPVGAVVGAAGLSWLTFTSTATAIAVLLLLRGLTDYMADVSLVAGLNAGALVGIAVIAVAGTRLALAEEARGLPAAAFGLAAIAFWFLIAYTSYGMEDSLVRELVRTVALVAVALVALNHRGTLTPSRLATIVVWTSVIPALTVIVEGAINWQDLAGDFRARGALAHPNSAALLFAVTVVLATWRWACDGGGRRYLLALAILGMALVLTRSMGGITQAVLGLFVFALIYGGRTNRWIITGTVVAFVVFMATDPFGISRFDELQSTDFHATEWRDTTNTLDWRFVNTTHYLRAWQESPVLGLGFGTTAEIVKPIGYQPHSDPLRVLVELGLLGAIPLALLYFAWMNHLVVHWRHGPHASYFAAMLATFVGITAHAFVTHSTLQTAPMFLIAVLVGATLTFGKPSAHERTNVSNRASR